MHWTIDEALVQNGSLLSLSTSLVTRLLAPTNCQYFEVENNGVNIHVLSDIDSKGILLEVNVVVNSMRYYTMSKIHNEINIWLFKVLCQYGRMLGGSTLSKVNCEWYKYKSKYIAGAIVRTSCNPCAPFTQDESDECIIYIALTDPIGYLIFDILTSNLDMVTMKSKQIMKKTIGKYYVDIKEFNYTDISMYDTLEYVQYVVTTDITISTVSSVETVISMLYDKLIAYHMHGLSSIICLKSITITHRETALFGIKKTFDCIITYACKYDYKA